MTVPFWNENKAENWTKKKSSGKTCQRSPNILVNQKKTKKKSWKKNTKCQDEKTWGNLVFPTCPADKFGRGEFVQQGGKPHFWVAVTELLVCFMLFNLNLSTNHEAIANFWKEVQKQKKKIISRHHQQHWLGWDKT